jgi:hypothetical protein
MTKKYKNLQLKKSKLAKYFFSPFLGVFQAPAETLNFPKKTRRSGDLQ